MPRRTILWAAYAVACSLLLEGSLQLYYRFTVGQWLATRTAQPIFAADPNGGFRLRANLSRPHASPEFQTHIYTDANGFRVSAPETAIPEKGASESTRIMLLGPSFAFGWGVDYEETLLARLLERLAGETGGEIEILNAGVPALGPVQQLRWFRAEGHEYRPDLVIQFVYGSLAVSPGYNEEFRVDKKGRLVPANATFPRRAFGELKKSAVIFHGWLAWSHIRQTLGGSPDRRIVGAGRTLSEPAAFDPTSHEVETSVRFYEELERAVTSAGGRLLIVTFPLAYVVHPEDLDRWRHLGVVDVGESVRFNREFSRHLLARGFHCLDLTEELVRAAEETEERLYFRIDIHWTPLGHDVAARAVAEHLRTWPLFQGEVASLGASQE